MTVSTQTSVRIGIAGLGTVGVGAVKILTENAALISARSGRDITVTAVSARSKATDRGVDLAGYAWCEDAVDIASRDDVDCVVELIGGADGPAYDLAKATLENGKDFVTANKALIATHGRELATLAEKSGSVLKFEAAVAGGIPIIKAITEGLAANKIEGLYGILNGTCNYILTRMEREGLDFASVLKDAQELGYAEADPSFDIDGVDTAHKTVILAALAFGGMPNLDGIEIEGIRHVSRTDIDYANELGYRIKLLGVARMGANGLQQRVHPTMVPKSSAIADVHEATNAVVVEADFLGQSVYEGAGAGEGPTASSVVADLIDVARGNKTPAFGVPVASLVEHPAQVSDDQNGSFYVRLRVEDKPGVLSDLTTVLRDLGVSIGSLLQRGSADEGGVYVVFTTHKTRKSDIVNAAKQMEQLNSVLDKAVMLRIEHL